MSRAEELADQFRNGNLRLVASEVVCDGPTALALAAILDPEELSRLRRAVDDHLDHRERLSPLFVGGEARGGPVMIPMRGVVR